MSQSISGPPPLPEGSGQDALEDRPDLEKRVAILEQQINLILDAIEELEDRINDGEGRPKL